MIETTYRCDKCKKQVESADKLLGLAIGARRGAYCAFDESLAIDLCPSCCEKVGIIRRIIKNDQVVNEPIKLKDRLYDVFADIIKELGVSAEV